MKVNVLKTFFRLVSLTDAHDYQKKRRNFPPAVYSERRLKQANRPICHSVYSSSLNRVFGRIMNVASDVTSRPAMVSNESAVVAPEITVGTDAESQADSITAEDTDLNLELSQLGEFKYKKIP